jgi:hypothetical protein
MTRIESLSCFGDASFFHSPQKLENACRNGCGERLFMMQIYAMGATTSVEILQKIRDGMLYFIMPRIPAQHVCQQCHLYWECVFKREYGKRIKGEHEKHKGEKTKITLADKSKKELHTAATQSSK